MALLPLRVRDDAIVDADGEPVRLRGVSIGGFMHLENFINGYPGTGHELRQQFEELVGAPRAEFFFRRMMDHFFTEDDVRFIRETGANVIRLPLNYRHFEHDDHPFEYLEEGFERVDRVVEWCDRHGVYVILDGHAVQGWQNTDWSSDNACGRALLWRHRQFQDRFVAWWERLAERYRGVPAIAGYDLLNEPMGNAPPGGGFDKAAYRPAWRAINDLYRRTVTAIRAVDPDHIVFLEGEGYSERFGEFDAPFDDQLVYSCHQYTAPGFGPGPYPGEIRGRRWDADAQREALHATEGFQFARRHGVPLWLGEFGAVYNGPAAEVPARLRALDDQLHVLDSEGIHWTLWTYKDCGVLGWVTLDPTSDYMQRTASVRQLKVDLDTDFWIHWLPDTPHRRLRQEMADRIASELSGSRLDPEAHFTHLSLALTGYTGALLQPAYVESFGELSEAEIDECLASFALARCQINRGLVEIVTRHCGSAT